ncbi:MAG: single-stranded DNA-binding protein [Flavobacteriales bacterium]
MNALRNKVQLIGRLGADVELKTLDNGNCVARISVATNESYKNKAGERVDDTTWHNVVAWGKTAELAKQILKKGSEVALEGKLSNRSYETKEGEKKYISEVVMSEFLSLDKKEKAAVPAPF